MNVVGDDNASTLGRYPVASTDVMHSMKRLRLFGVFPDATVEVVSGYARGGGRGAGAGGRQQGRSPGQPLRVGWQKQPIDIVSRTPALLNVVVMPYHWTDETHVLVGVDPPKGRRS